MTDTQIIDKLLDSLEIGPAVAIDNLAMLPLYGPVADGAGYLTLDEALGDGKAEITEVSEAGSVPELRFRNPGDERVLLVDGEELVGAKQNRILNVSILAAAHSEIVIPVSCVEAGRWAHRSRRFSTAPRTQYAAARAARMAQVSERLVASDGLSRRGDQGAIWSDIEAKFSRLGAESPTAAMSDLYDSFEDRIERYTNGVAAAPRQTGAVFAINGKIVGLDLFDRPETLARLLPKLVRSYALDALDVDRQEQEAPEEGDVHAFVAALGAAKAARFDAVGEGEELRLDGAGTVGAALVVDGRVVHLGAFRQAEADRNTEDAFVKV